MWSFDGGFVVSKRRLTLLSVGDVEIPRVVFCRVDGRSSFVVESEDGGGKNVQGAKKPRSFVVEGGVEKHRWFGLVVLDRIVPT